MPKRRKSGFTLIELLITISILAILSIIGFTSFNTFQVKSRDFKRKSDLNEIAVALELYYQSNQHTYPLNKTGSTEYTSASGGNWFAELAPYIKNLPVDPINGMTSSVDPVTGMTSTTSHYYAYWPRGSLDPSSTYKSSSCNAPGSSSPGASGYYLIATMEDKSDSNYNQSFTCLMWDQSSTSCTIFHSQSPTGLYILTDPHKQGSFTSQQHIGTYYFDCTL